MGRYFVLEEVSKEKFDKIQGELNTNIEIEKTHFATESIRKGAKNIDGFGVELIAIKDWSMELPSTDLEETFGLEAYYKFYDNL